MKLLGSKYENMELLKNLIKVIKKSDEILLAKDIVKNKTYKGIRETKNGYEIYLKKINNKEYIYFDKPVFILKGGDYKCFIAENVEAKEHTSFYSSAIKNLTIAEDNATLSFRYGDVFNIYSKKENSYIEIESSYINEVDAPLNAEIDIMFPKSKYYIKNRNLSVERKISNSSNNKLFEKFVYLNYLGKNFSNRKLSNLDKYKSDDYLSRYELQYPYIFLREIMEIGYSYIEDDKQTFELFGFKVKQLDKNTFEVLSLPSPHFYLISDKNIVSSNYYKCLIAPNLVLNLSEIIDKSIRCYGLFCEKLFLNNIKKDVKLNKINSSIIYLNAEKEVDVVYNSSRCRRIFKKGGEKINLYFENISKEWIGEGAIAVIGCDISKFISESPKLAEKVVLI